MQEGARKLDTAALAAREAAGAVVDAVFKVDLAEFMLRALANLGPAETMQSPVER